ncbi:MAG TPA: AAA family ATPase [Candidatus Paceibacterota bacterium]
MKKEIITICGGLGSGKSSTSDLVAKELGYTRFSSGDLFRQVGLDLGLSVTELNKKAETESSIDFKVDEKLRELGNSNKIVIDSRTAFHWIPASFKVYLDLPHEIAKHRVLNNLKENALRKESEKSSNIEEVYEDMQRRFDSEQKRFWDLYKINNRDLTQFDLVVDTNKNNLEEVVAIIVAEYKKWQTSS